MKPYYVGVNGFSGWSMRGFDTREDAESNFHELERSVLIELTGRPCQIAVFQWLSIEGSTLPENYADYEDNDDS